VTITVSSKVPLKLVHQKPISLLTMGKIQNLLLFFALLPTFSAQAGHNPKECRELEDLAVRLVNQMNSIFDLKVKTEFITKANNGPKIPGEPILRPSLLDANSANDTLQLPKPCFMSEAALPSKELWSLIIAHEYSHKIIDQRQDKCFQAFVKSQPLSSEELRERDHMHHANNDILGLKILSELKMNARNGIWDLGDYVKQHRKEIGTEGANAYEKRVKYMKQIWPTDFESGEDFFFGEYFDGFKEMNNYIPNRHPRSTLIRDLQKGVSTVDGCFIVKPEKAKESLLIWRNLDSVATQPRQSKKPGVK